MNFEITTKHDAFAIQQNKQLNKIDSKKVSNVKFKQLSTNQHKKNVKKNYNKIYAVQTRKQGRLLVCRFKRIIFN